MTFYRLCHRKPLDLTKKSKLVTLFCVGTMGFYTTVGLAQSEPEETSAPSWEVSESIDSQQSEQSAQDAFKAQVEAAVEARQENKEQSKAPQESESGGTSTLLSDLNAKGGLRNLASPTDTLVETAPLPNLPVRPVLNIDDDLRRQLEVQFQAIQDLRDTEDAFSEKLGEGFFSYADALQRAGRLEEAREMFAQALHLNKINNGVNNISQRPILRSLAGIELAEGDLESAEQYVSRMIWLEKQNRTRDTLSFDIILALANKLLDKYLYRPVAGETSIGSLNRASNYFDYLIRRYGAQPLDKLLMPYGELAYTQYLKSRLATRAASASYITPARSQSPRGFDSFNRDQRRLLSPRGTGPTNLGRGEVSMRQYLNKALNSGNVEHAVRALLNIGDVNHLFGRTEFAAGFYKHAWAQAQKLDENHELVIGMSRPHKLPNFYFASDRKHDELETHTPRTNVPLEISVTKFGRVNTVFTDSESSDNPKLIARARRAAKQVVFRPAIQGGEVVGTDRYTENIRVVVRKSDTAKTDTSGN